MPNKLTDDYLKWTLDVDGKPAINELGKLEQNTRKLEKTNKDLRVELQKMEAAGKKNSKEYKNLQAQIKNNNQTIALSKAKMSELRKEVGLNALTMRQLQSRARELSNQLKNTTPGTDKFKKYNKELQAVNKRQQELKTSTGNVNKVFGSFKSLLPTLVPAAIIATIARLGKHFYELAKQMEGENRRASIVFGDSLSYVEKQAAVLSKRMGVTEQQFTSMAAATADLLIPLDFSRQKAAEMSVELQSLTGALDEWTAGSVGAKEISNILTKAMLGENEQLKQLGIAIRKDTDEYRNMVKQLMETEGVTKAQAEALTTLNLIKKKSTDAQAAYNKEGNKLLRLEKEITRWVRSRKEAFIKLFDVEEKQVDLFKLENKELNASFEVLKRGNVSVAARKKLINEINEKYGEYLPNLLSEKSTLEDLEKAQKAINDQLRINIISQSMRKEITKLYEEQAAAVDGLVQTQINEEKARSKLISTYDDQEAARLKNEIQIASFVKQFNQGIIDNLVDDEEKIKNKYKRIADYYKIAFKEVENTVAGLGTEEPKQSETGGDINNEEDQRKAEALVKLRLDALEEGKEKELTFEANRHNQALEQWKGNAEAIELENTIHTRNLNEINQKYLDKQLANQAFNHEQKIALLDLAFKNEEISVAEYNERKKILEEEFQQKMHDFKKEYALYSNDELIQQEIDSLTQSYEFKKLTVEEQEKAIQEIKDKYKKDEQEKVAANLSEEVQLLYNNLSDEKKAMYQKTKVYMDAATNIGESFGTMLISQEESGKKFLKNTFLTALNALQKHLNMRTAWATITSLSMADSIATFGISGIARAAAISGLMNAAFGVAKAAISKQLVRGRYDVIGAEDGRLYANVPYKGRVKESAIIKGKTLISERGDEMVLTAPHVRNIQMNYPTLMNSIMATRVPQRAEGRYPQEEPGPGIISDTSIKLEGSINELNAHLSYMRENGIRAWMPYTEFEAKLSTMEKIKNKAKK